MHGPIDWGAGLLENARDRKGFVIMFNKARGAGTVRNHDLIAESIIEFGSDVGTQYGLENALKGFAFCKFDRT